MAANDSSKRGETLSGKQEAPTEANHKNTQREERHTKERPPNQQVGGRKTHRRKRNATII